VGEATTCAIYPDSRNPLAFPELLAEGLDPWVVREVWYAGGPNPDHAVDITDLFPQRVAALQAHASQTAHMDVAGWLRARFAAEAQAAGLPAGRLAETFTVLRTE
jgi:LmbE family N-acetylglucosaminyl deacetylase